MDISNKQHLSDSFSPSLVLLFDQMNAGFAQSDLAGNFTHVNDRYCEMTGYSRIELLSKNLSNITHPDDVAANLPLLRKCVEEGINFIIEKRYVRKDKSEMWVKNSVSRITGADHSYFLSAVCIDITEHVESKKALASSEARYRQLSEDLDQQVRERTRELKRSNDELQQFAHVASHDLKEPVRRQGVLLSRLREKYAEFLPAEALESLDKIEKCTKRMNSMISSILAYSEHPETLLPEEPLDLCAIAKEAIVELELLIEETGAVVHCDDLPSVKGSGILLYQVFYNLLCNALKFVRPSVTPRITISGQLVDHAVQIEVRDNGIGFTNQEAELIFRTYARLHSKSQYEGTGLGLSLCRKIVEQHGGTITAKGEPGNGACFCVALPA